MPVLDDSNLTASGPSGITGCEYVESGLLGINEGTAYRCVHETDHFRIEYVLEGTGVFAADSTSATPDDVGGDTFTTCSDPISPTNCNGVPDYIDKVAQGLEDAYAIYVIDLAYPVSWTGTVPVQIRDIDGGQVLPNQPVLSPNPISDVETIEIETNDGSTPGAPYYLARHELFHVFQYQYINDFSLTINVATEVGPWWWMEATAEWASGYATRSGARGDSDLYVQRLPDFLGRPNEKLSSFDEPGCCRQYGAFVFAEYLVEFLARDAAGSPIYEADVVRQTWEELADDAAPQLVEPALDAVVQRYNTSLRALLPEFTFANYLLAYDDAVGGGVSDVESRWRPALENVAATASDDIAPARPLRQRRNVAHGHPVSGALVVAPGGASYVDLVPPEGDSGELSIDIGGAIDGRLHARVLTLAYPTPPQQPTVCLETPIFIDSDGNGSVSVPILPACRYAVLILTGIDVDAMVPIEFGWSAEFVDPTVNQVLDSFSRTRANGPGMSDAGYTWTSGSGSGPDHPGFDAENGVGHFRWDTGDTDFTWFYGYDWGGAHPGSVVDLQLDVKFNECWAEPYPNGVWYRAKLLIQASPINVEDPAAGYSGAISATCPDAHGRSGGPGEVWVSRNYDTPLYDPVDVDVGEWWTIRYYADMRLSKVKAWPQGTAEPVDWQVTYQSEAENGGSYYPNGIFRLWRYVDTEIDNLIDRRPFYAISERRSAWEPFWQENEAAAGTFDSSLPDEWSFVVSGNPSEPYVANASSLALLWADDAVGPSSTAISRSVLTGEFAGDFEVVTQYAYGALQPWNEYLSLRVRDESGDAIDVSLRMTQGTGSIGFKDGTTVPFSWAGYNPDADHPPIGTTYFVRWQHTSSGDRLKVWEDGKPEPLNWQAEQGPTAGWTDAVNFDVTYNSEQAADRWSGGWLGLYFIDVD